MSTPIKPPGGPGSPGAAEPGTEPGRIEERPGQLSELVESARADAERVVSPQSASRLDAVRADLAAGRIDVDQAIDRLVQHALAKAADLPAAYRGALEAQLRAALAEDPTLISLRKDLTRGSHG